MEYHENCIMQRKITMCTKHVHSTTVFIENANSIQSNLNSSNTDGSFATSNSNSILSPRVLRPIAQENKYLGKFSCFIMNCMLGVFIRIVSSRRF